MTKKTDRIEEILSAVKPRWPMPVPAEDRSLFEQGLFGIVQRHERPDRAKAAFERLCKAYDDWNEMRVSQVQEIAAVLKGKGARVGHGPLRDHLPAARAIKDYAQDVFQKTHGLDLEFLRDDEAGAGKMLAQLHVLGFATGAFVLWLASDRRLPVHSTLVRTIDRLAISPRTASMKKARAALEPLVPSGRTLEFAYAFGEVADRWCDARKPMCWECPLVDDCPFGKKTFKDWKVQQERLAAQRAREEARRLIADKKEEERRKREAERQRKRLEAEKKKADRERDRVRRLQEREKEKAAREKERAAAAAAREAARKERERKESEAKKQAVKKKKATKKAAKKPTKKPARKAAAKKPARKVASKAATRKAPAKKKVAKKTTKKTAKKTTKKTAKKATKKTAQKATKKATRKTGTKKASSRKKTTTRRR